MSVVLADLLLGRKLLQFGLLEGLIRRVQKYPVQLVTTESSFSRLAQQQQPQRQLSRYLDGGQCYDEISCHTGLSTGSTSASRSCDVMWCFTAALDIVRHFYDINEFDSHSTCLLFYSHIIVETNV